MTRRFQKAYGALLNAYFNETLAKGSCMACAVGNIVADAQGTSIVAGMVEGSFEVSTVGHENTWWTDLFLTSSGTRFVYDEENSDPSAVMGFYGGGFETMRFMIDRIRELTGYSFRELAMMEEAFERNARIHFRDYPKHSARRILEDQFNGLSAVVDVMLRLDGMTDDGSLKDRFREKSKPKPKSVYAACGSWNVKDGSS